MKPELDWMSYEELVRDIYLALGKDKGVTIQCHGASCKVIGKSGVTHQIDVLTRHSDGMHEYFTAIECKHWKDKVDKDIVMKVSEIIDDAGVSKGVIVAKMGFTPDAITYAKNRNISLVELREPVEKDWEGKIKDVVIDLNVIKPFITKIKFLASVEDTLQEKKIQSYVVRSSTGDKPLKEVIDEFAEELYEQNADTNFEKKITFDDETFLIEETSGYRIQVKGVLIGGHYKIEKIHQEIKGEDHVWLVMQSLFDNRLMTISPTGEVRVKR
ncbi:MAG TPA: restriction endonuclease [Chryseolinea sp.]